MGRVHISPLLLRHADIKYGTKVQFYTYKSCIIIKKIQDLPFHEEIKSMNFIRTIDGSGRLVIPKSIRKIYDIGLHDNIEMDIVNREIVLRKIKKENEPLDLIKSFIELEINGYFQTRMKHNNIFLTDFAIRSLDLEVNMEVQFFIKDKNTLIAKKHQYKFSTERDLYFTGQSRIINKNRSLNIPKKLRDYLNINNEDSLMVRILEDHLCIKKIN